MHNFFRSCSISGANFGNHGKANVHRKRCPIYSNRGHNRCSRSFERSVPIFPGKQSKNPVAQIQRAYGQMLTECACLCRNTSRLHRSKAGLLIHLLNMPESFDHLNRPPIMKKQDIAVGLICRATYAAGNLY